MNVETTISSPVRVGVILPVYNVEQTVGPAISQICDLLGNQPGEILVIDNKSTDESLYVARTTLTESTLDQGSWKIVENEVNLGYGASVREGFRFFSSRDVTHYLVLHSDGQADNFILARSLIKALRESGADLALGSRFLDESDLSEYSKFRKYANVFFNQLTALSSGVEISDAGSAMILVRKDLALSIPESDLPNDWRFHPVLNMALTANPEVQVVNIPMRWSDSEAGSSVPVLRYGLQLFGLLIGAWWRRSISRSPRWWRADRPHAFGIRS